MGSDEIYDVLILGYGPVGATFANLLGQDGHRVAVAEMHHEIYDKPRAVNLDQEALRLWQRIGLAGVISEGCAPHPGTDFLGVDGAPIKSIYSAPPPYPLGWPANLMFVQPEAERHLRARVTGLDSVDVWLGFTATGLDQQADHVAVTFDTKSGPKTLRARYLVGCDGANSPTRGWMGVTQTDLAFSEHYVVVDAWLTRDTPLPPRTSHFCWPDAPTSYVVCSDRLRRWELKILPHEDIDSYHNIDQIKKRMAPFVDVEALKFWRSSVYHFDARVVDTWQQARVFLAGDAAHTMPPFLGQGLNSGLRDVANLAWKLDYVLRGKAGDGLLASYQTERRPHIMKLTEITKTLGQIIGETDPVKVAERDKTLRAEMAANGPVVVRQALIPPLTDGFLDAQGGALAGTLAPQPRVDRDGGTHLLDDLLSGFSLIENRQGALHVTTDIDSDAPKQFVCHDGDGVMADVLGTDDCRAMIIRPDGVVWSAGADLAEATQRLRAALVHPSKELCP